MNEFEASLVHIPEFIRNKLLYQDIQGIIKLPRHIAYKDTISLSVQCFDFKTAAVYAGNCTSFASLTAE